MVQPDNGDMYVEPSIVYQPIVDIMTGSVIGYEALSRLAGREEDGFRPLHALAKKRKCLPATLCRAQELALELAHERPVQTILFINATSASLQNSARTVAPGELPFQDIVFELPERTGTSANWDALLAPVRASGAMVAIDDWGVGEADPLRMIRLKPDWLKIDRSLVIQINQDPGVAKLIEVLVQWVDVRGVRIIAEGCETWEQVERLRALGVRYAQGFVLARPGRQWITTVHMPAPGLRLGQLHGIPLALARAAELTDAHLELIEAEQPRLVDLLSTATSSTVSWIRRSAAGVHLDDPDAMQRYEAALTQHLQSLTRGRLSLVDVDRARTIVNVHQRLGLDLSWYVMAYRELQAFVAQRLRNNRQTDLAEAIRGLFAWDMAITMEAYQSMLDHDALTSILTRRAFWTRGEYLLHTDMLRNHVWAFVILDVDEFKAINDTLGHVAGDSILRQIGNVLHDFMAPDFLVARLGGDEFAVLLRYRTAARLQTTVQAVRGAVRQSVKGVRLTAGIAVLGRDGASLDALYQAADVQLYANRRKQRGAQEQSRPGVVPQFPSALHR